MFDVKRRANPYGLKLDYYVIREGTSEEGVKLS